MDPLTALNNMPPSPYASVFDGASMAGAQPTTMVSDIQATTDFNSQISDQEIQALVASAMAGDAAAIAQLRQRAALGDPAAIAALGQIDAKANFAPPLSDEARQELVADALAGDTRAIDELHERLALGDPMVMEMERNGTLPSKTPTIQTIQGGTMPPTQMIPSDPGGGGGNTPAAAPGGGSGGGWTMPPPKNDSNTSSGTDKETDAERNAREDKEWEDYEKGLDDKAKKDKDKEAVDEPTCIGKGGEPIWRNMGGPKPEFYCIMPGQPGYEDAKAKRQERENKANPKPVSTEQISGNPNNTGDPISDAARTLGDLTSGGGSGSATVPNTKYGDVSMGVSRSKGKIIGESASGSSGSTPIKL